uniref:Sec1 family domain containing 1 n=1 Tax=Sus scrofa TaxID=9823 RepID=A0A8D1VYM5_PIG
MAAAAAASIRERQTVALKRMLNFNVPHVKNSAGEPVWKVLIYDRFGQDIISPLLSVKELRDMGITLHLLLHSDRDPIPDVPAVYFVMPTEENIDRLCQDLRNQLYESYYLNFISAISRSKLEDIANAALAASAVTQVFFFFFDLFVFSRVALVAYGGSQARGPIGAVATGLCQSHSNAGSEPHLQPIPQLRATPDP